jgi:pilus assembly protein CpaB
MKPKTMILLVVAIGCGLVASYLTSKVLADRSPGEAQVEMVKVLAAKRNLALGTVIKDPERFFEEKEVPKNSAPKKGYGNFADIKNLKLVKPVSEDAFLTKDDVMDTGSDIFIQSIPAGYRAVSIKVTPETMAGGFVQPNTRVDVMTTLKRDREESVSQVILQNMLVLATDQEANRDPNVGGKLANTVTLAAKPDDALKLTLASSLGEVRLILRKFGEDETSNTKTVKVSDILKGTQSASDPNEDSGSTKEIKTSPDIKTPEPPMTEEKSPVVEEPVKYWVQEIRNGENVVRIKRREDGKDLEDSSEITKSDPAPAPRPQRKAFDGQKQSNRLDSDSSKKDDK